MSLKDSPQPDLKKKLCSVPVKRSSPDGGPVFSLPRESPDREESKRVSFQTFASYLARRGKINDGATVPPQKSNHERHVETARRRNNGCTKGGQLWFAPTSAGIMNMARPTSTILCTFDPHDSVIPPTGHIQGVSDVIDFATAVLRGRNEQP